MHSKGAMECFCQCTLHFFIFKPFRLFDHFHMQIPAGIVASWIQDIGTLSGFYFVPFYSALS